MELCRTWGYARVSTEDQANEGTSLERQIERIVAYAKASNLPNFCEDQIFVDRGTSAYVHMVDRVYGAKLMESVRQNDHVIFTSIDRAFRSIVDARAILDRLIAIGVRVHVLDLGGCTVDFSTPYGKMVFSMLAAVAELERDIIRNRCNEGHRRRALERHLVHNSNQCPSRMCFGWKPGFIDGKVAAVPVPEYQKIIAAFWHLYQDLHWDPHSIASFIRYYGMYIKKLESYKRVRGPEGMKWVQVESRGHNLWYALWRRHERYGWTPDMTCVDWEVVHKAVWWKQNRKPIGNRLRHRGRVLFAAKQMKMELEEYYEWVRLAKMGGYGQLYKEMKSQGFNLTAIAFAKIHGRPPEAHEMPEAKRLRELELRRKRLKSGKKRGMLKPKKIKRQEMPWPGVDELPLPPPYPGSGTAASS